jgi:hypothetical protein
VEEHNHIDELIRQKFEGFEPVPPASVWDKVKSEIGPDTAPGGGISLPIITGLIILVGLVSLLWLINRMETAIPEQQTYTPALSDNFSSFVAPAEDQLVANASYLSYDADELTENNHSNRVLSNSSIPVRKPFDGQPAYQGQDKSLPLEARPETIKNKTSRKPGNLERFTQETLRVKGKEFEGTIDNERTTDLVQGQRENWQGYRNQDYVRSLKPQWSIGLYFNPDITFYPSDNFTNGVNYSLQILPRLSFNHWYLQSGIGVRAGGDRGDLRVDYNKFLGSYEDVYEVTFDSTENGVIPTYHTETVDVYDTVPYYSISESKASYAYLDVPLLVGREWSFNKVSFYMHAGPSLSILLGRSSPQADYPDENIRILNESPQIPAREQINWQIMAGAGLNYSFSDRLSLGLEPTFRYYLTKDYDKNQLNTRHPYSFGLRAGLIYHINH